MLRNILVVNDDGIDALGVHKLAEALSEAGNVYVCSPHTQQSATGHGITIGKLVIVEDVDFPEAIKAVSMEGTPADCVKIGLEHYRNKGVEIDMVFSGFNHGMNLGTDTLYSGTVSAALEGAICGLPSAAISISSPNSFHRTPDNYEAAMSIASQIAKSEMFSDLIAKNPRNLDINFIHEEHVILSVNVPDLPAKEIKGVKVCPLSYRVYDEWFREKTSEDGRAGYHYSGSPKVIGEADPDESDIAANKHGYATVTPLCFDLTNREALSAWRGFDWKI